MVSFRGGCPEPQLCAEVSCEGFLKRCNGRERERMLLVSAYVKMCMVFKKRFNLHKKENRCFRSNQE